jgi:Asp-tRNA(Asn)/Glu-tRNA(Gln) amidotransferase A subunit family amidase
VQCPAGGIQAVNAADSLCRLSAAKLARRIHEKRISPVEVVWAYLDRIECFGPELNALAHFEPAGGRGTSPC